MEPNYGYRHTRGFIVFLIIIFCGWVIVAHSQVSNTGNLVGSTWNNGYSVPALTCWQPGDPGCSPGRPYVRPDGNINFSYSATELYQTRALADVLPYSGTGLMVTGFQYNWRSKNGNGWDDGRLDVLQAYVQMYSKGGQWIESQTYNLNFVHNWTDFSWSGTLSKERRGSDLGTILYGFYGKDNNYWMGPYGPEITNISFSLRYQPDPCIVNPLHSTDCPGFLKAIASPAYQAQENISTSTNSSLSNKNITTQINLPITIKLNTKQIQNTLDSLDLNIANESSVNNNQSKISSNYINQNVNSSVRSNLSKENSTRLDTNQEIQTLDQPFISMTQNTSSSTVIGSSSQSVQPRNSNQIQTNESDSSVQTQISLFRAPEPVTINLLDNQVNYSLLEPIRQSTEQQPVSIPSIAIITPQQAIQTLEPITTQEPLRPQTIELPIETQTNTIAGALIDKTNPLNDALNGQPLIMQTSTTFAGPSVNTTIADNDLAGGVSINQIARVLVGFDVYQNLAVREIAFYQPREIYRGQRTVDNVRALRSLGQDARHQEMVNQQYLPR